MNDFHFGACGSRLSGLATAQKILRAWYFWPSVFKDCINVIKTFHSYQIFSRKMHSHPAPLHPIDFVGPFAKWGIDFCHVQTSIYRWPSLHYCGHRLFHQMGRGDSNLFERCKDNHLISIPSHYRKVWYTPTYRNRSCYRLF